ncbi:MAG: 30S ribosomal protein S20 [Planctomycetota bacterium]|nr:30S ribosomal protein S20 [Planctomycetota bacterium]
MAHSRSARKRVRQNLSHRSANRWRLRAMRAAMKDFRGKLAADDVAGAKESLKTCCSVIDKTAQKGVIHRNQAARRKSRLNAALKAKVLA